MTHNHPVSGALPAITAMDLYSALYRLQDALRAAEALSDRLEDIPASVRPLALAMTEYAERHRDATTPLLADLQAVCEGRARA